MPTGVTPIPNTTSKAWGSNRKLLQPRSHTRRSWEKLATGNVAIYIFRSTFTSGHLLANFSEQTPDKMRGARETWGGLSFLPAQAIKFLIAGDRAAFESHLHRQKR